MKTPPTGIVGLVALLAALAGAVAWAAMLSGPLDLARGLLGARDHLERAESALEEPDFTQARYETAAAGAGVRRAKEGLRNGGPLLDLSRLVPALDDALSQVGHVTTALEHSVRGASGAVEIAAGALSGPDRVLAEDPDGDGGIIRLDRIEVLGSQISAVREELRLARRALLEVDLDKLPGRAAPGVRRGLRETARARAVLADAEEGFALLPGILGAEGPRTYLIGMQNPAEQRGTGGAILQFATLHIDRGKPELGDDEGSASTVYEIDEDRELLDIPLPEEAWYHRGIPDARRFGNANWSPHWPLSAQLLVAYGNASADRSPEVEFEDPDGVIAVDPITVQRLMPAIGSYDLRTGHEITANNVVNFVLYRAYGEFPDRVRRRNVLRQVVDGFYRGMLDARRPTRLVNGFGRALGDKNVQIWMEDREEQRFVKKMGWSGTIERAHDDGYTSVIEQNVGGNKLDLFAELRDTISVAIEGEAAEVSTQVHVRNEVFLPQPSWVVGDAGPMHRPMINLYVPNDAVLNSWDAPATCPPTAQFEVVCRRDTPEPARWIAGPPENLEADKKVWSGTIEVPPGQEGTLSFDYTMPGTVRTINGRRSFTFVVQQQPKVRPKTTEVRIRLPEGATEVRAPGFSVQDGGVLVWESRTRQDQELSISWRE